jgi:hypothetical protein
VTHHLRCCVLWVEPQPYCLWYAETLIVVCVDLRTVPIDQRNVQASWIGVTQYINGQLQLSTQVKDETASTKVRKAAALLGDEWKQGAVSSVINQSGASLMSLASLSPFSMLSG